jgi:hypothetical protein
MREQRRELAGHGPRRLLRIKLTPERKDRGCHKALGAAHGLPNNAEHLVNFIGRVTCRILREPLRRQMIGSHTNLRPPVDFEGHAQEHVREPGQGRDAVLEWHARLEFSAEEVSCENANHKQKWVNETLRIPTFVSITIRSRRNPVIGRL